jgi:transcriptional regulator with XRE-family HTH domain
MSLRDVEVAATTAGHKLTGSAVHRIVRGERAPTVSSLAALAAALDVTFGIGKDGLSVTEKRRRAI